jgi:putative phage-type endonuclease
MDAAFHAERMTGIGGSDIGAICGLSKFKTPYQVWAEKVGASEGQADNEAMAWGRFAEPIIRDWYCKTTGHAVLVPPMLRHPTHNFLICHLDGDVIGTQKILEIKTARTADGWGEPGTDSIPIYYMTQVQHNMACAEKTICDLPVSFFGSLPVIYTVEADPEIQEMLTDKASEFWELVTRRTPPDPICYADVQAIYGKASRASEVTAPAGIEASVRRLKELSAHAKALEAEQDDLKCRVCAAMGERDTLVDVKGQILATWKKAKDGTAFDAKAFGLSHPEIYAKFTKPKPGSRRLLLK